MINRNKYQLLVCKKMLDTNGMVRGCFLDDDYYAVSVDGFTCVIVDAKNAVFDISKIRTSVTLKEVCARSKDDVEVYPTDEMRNPEHGRYLLKLASKDGKMHAWIANAIYKEFSGYRYYAHDPRSRVLIEDGCGVPVGVMMPTRVKEDK